jgi:hypothetical protein
VIAKAVAYVRDTKHPKQIVGLSADRSRLTARKHLGIRVAVSQPLVAGIDLFERVGLRRVRRGTRSHTALQGRS